MTLDTPVSQLPRVGSVVAKRLALLGVHTTKDLLYYFPFRYEDYSTVVPLRSVPMEGQISVKGTIELIANKRSPRTRTIITEAVIGDGDERLRVVWFGQPFLTTSLQVGDEVYLSGNVKTDRFGTALVSPVYEKYQGNKETTHTARIVPIYSLTQGLVQKQIRTLIAQVVPLADTMPDWLPEDIRVRAQVTTLGEALHRIHFPESNAQELAAVERLKFDELFILQLRAAMIRQSLTRTPAPVCAFVEGKIREFVASLPFTLTAYQKKAAWEIMQDMGRRAPMHRLLEGDVGSGKTVVAALALHLATLHDYQGVIMAPTEILATQHFATLQALFEKTETSLALVTRTMRKVSRVVDGKRIEETVTKTDMNQLLESGAIHISVGTQALLTETVRFHALGLVIVDEQHRFGVTQRKLMHDKSGQEYMPHFLSMTATPIPRSLALFLYGDLDLSQIKGLPPGRLPIVTKLVLPHDRERTHAFIRSEVAQGHQAFVICPLIEETDTDERTVLDERKSVMNEYKKLSEKIFPTLRVGYLHGRMHTKDKDYTMQQFAAGAIDILVATSVVEVGVNIPNATVMMIEGSEHFGLAQLHQFRGRVGRSQWQSYCFLFTESQTPRERLGYFAKHLDGFALAEYDLHDRGPGEVYGTTQSGMMELKLATLRDTDLIARARDIASGIDFEKYPTLRDAVRAFENTVHLE